MTRFFLLFFICALYAGQVYGQPVRTGAEVLQEDNFELLRGKRVGLITNQSAMAGPLHIVQLMNNSGQVHLAALFGAEHGLSGLLEDGVTVEGKGGDLDRIPTFSLYGETLKPTVEMLRGIDLLVFDIQDIGSRFYTYISTMG